MGINLLSLQPHQVSRDLRGYSVFFYGEPKSGKTTIATKFPDSLLLAFEKGYNTLAGIMVQPINSWGEFNSVLRELKKKEIKEKFSTIIIDTADIAYDYCNKYVLDNYQKSDGTFGVDKVGDIPYGAGYGLIAKEYDARLREIVMLGYGLVIISHSTDKTFKDENGVEFNRIVPTLDKRANNIVSRMADIIGYSRAVENENGEVVAKLFMRGTPRYEAGSRFKFIAPVIDFNYESLVNAIGDAIDKQSSVDGGKYYTDEAAANMYVVEELDYDDLMNSFKAIVQTLCEKDQNYYGPRITEITNKRLGRGVKASDCTREQVEALNLIVDDLKALASK